MTRLPKRIEAALNATGLPWTIEPGRRHAQIRIGGKLVGILPYGNQAHVGRHDLNTIAQIKRIVKGNVDEQSRR